MPGTYLQLLSAVAPVLLVILIGFAVRRLHWLSAESDRSLLSVQINLLTPCLIFDNVVGNEALRNLTTVVAAPALGFITVAGGFGLGLLTAAPFERDARIRRTFAMTTGLYNYGYLPLPLCVSLFDKATTGVLFLFNLGVELALWTVGVMILSGANGAGWKKAFNPPVAAIIMAVLLNFFGGRTFVPSFAADTIHLLAGAAIPLGLLLTGATLADLFTPNALTGGLRLTVLAIALRAGVTPWFFIGLALMIPGPVELERVLVIQGAMPAAVIPLILTRIYHGDPPTALRVILWTTIFGIITIPLWLKAGMQWAGLSP